MLFQRSQISHPSTTYNGFAVYFKERKTSFPILRPYFCPVFYVVYLTDEYNCHLLWALLLRTVWIVGFGFVKLGLVLEFLLTKITTQRSVKKGQKSASRTVSFRKEVFGLWLQDVVVKGIHKLRYIHHQAPSWNRGHRRHGIGDTNGDGWPSCISCHPSHSNLEAAPPERLISRTRNSVAGHFLLTSNHLS